MELKDMATFDYANAFYYRCIYGLMVTEHVYKSLFGHSITYLSMLAFSEG